MDWKALHGGRVKFPNTKRCHQGAAKSVYYCNEDDVVHSFLKNYAALAMLSLQSLWRNLLHG